MRANGWRITQAGDSFDTTPLPEPTKLDTRVEWSNLAASRLPPGDP